MKHIALFIISLMAGVNMLFAQSNIFANISSDSCKIIRLENCPSDYIDGKKQSFIEIDGQQRIEGNVIAVEKTTKINWDNDYQVVTFLIRIGDHKGDRLKLSKKVMEYDNKSLYLYVNESMRARGANMQPIMHIVTSSQPDSLAVGNPTKEYNYRLFCTGIKDQTETPIRVVDSKLIIEWSLFPQKAIDECLKGKSVRAHVNRYDAQGNFISCEYYFIVILIHVSEEK